MELNCFFVGDLFTVLQVKLLCKKKCFACGKFSVFLSTSRNEPERDQKAINASTHTNTQIMFNKQHENYSELCTHFNFLFPSPTSSSFEFVYEQKV